MSALHGSETQFEYTTIERLKQIGYRHLFGPEIERAKETVVLTGALRDALARRYPDLPAAALDDAMQRLSRPQGVDTLRRNLTFHHELLTRGFELPVESADGRKEHRHIHPIDWSNPANNDFVVVNQLPISGKNDRRPDLIIYVNGLPLVVFELKNPYAEKPTVDDAWNQLQHYAVDIPQLFEFNALCVVSDGSASLHGMWSAPREWFAPWKSIDGFQIEPGTTGSMKTLIEGLFAKERLLSYVRDFIVFEVDSRGVAKKGAKYHQFFAVRLRISMLITGSLCIMPSGSKMRRFTATANGSTESASTSKPIATNAMLL